MKSDGKRWRDGGEDVIDRNRLRFEALEDRRLMAVTLEVVSDFLPDGATEFRDGVMPPMAASQGQLFFGRLGNDLTAGGPAELWASEGSLSSTRLVNRDAFPLEMASANGIAIYSNLETDDTGGEVTRFWRSDGTTAGTSRFGEFEVHCGRPAGLMAQSVGQLYFYEETGLWVSDSTEAGTRLLANFPVEPCNGKRGGFVPSYNGNPYFAYDGGLWQLNGTGTGIVPSSPALPDSGQAIGVTLGRLYYLWNGDLWTRNPFSDLVLVKNNVDWDGTSVVAENKVLFGRSSGLWVSNGTYDGTRRLVAGELQPGFLTNVRGTVFLAIANGNQEMPTGVYSWDPRTEIFTRHTPDGFHIPPSADPLERAFTRHLTFLHGSVYFFGDDGTRGGYELFKLAFPRGDTNFDGQVNLADLNNVRNRFGFRGVYPGDVSENGVVDLDDLNIVRNTFGVDLPLRVPLPTVGSVGTRTQPASTKSVTFEFAHWQDVLFSLSQAPTLEKKACAVLARRQRAAADHVFASM